MEYTENCTPAPDLRAARRSFSTVGLACFVMLAAATLLQLAAGVLVARFAPQLAGEPWLLWVVTFAPLYVAAVPAGLAILRRLPKSPPAPGRMTPGHLIILFIISVFLMYAGNLIGVGILAAISALTGASAANPLTSYVMGGSLPVRILIMVVAAPLIEEYIFRKRLIDSLRPYGEKLAMLTSGLLFGLFHGNLSQFFYAFFLGALFAFVYLRTGRLRWTVLLHMVINFLGSVVAPLVLSSVDMSALDTMDAGSLMTPAFLGYALYAVAMLSLAVAGLVLFIARVRRVEFFPTELELPRGSRYGVAWLNAGVLLMLAGSLVLAATTFISV